MTISIIDIIIIIFACFITYLQVFGWPDQIYRLFDLNDLTAVKIQSFFWQFP